MRDVKHLAMPGTSEPLQSAPKLAAELPPGVPALQPPRCWCERDLALLNVASDTVKCIGCGFPMQECPCKRLVTSG